jgi:hypothetical protein
MWACHGINGFPSARATSATFGPYVGRRRLRAVENRGAGNPLQESLRVILLVTSPGGQRGNGGA